MVLYRTFAHTDTRLNTLVCILTPAFPCQTKKHKSRLMYKYTKQTNVGRKLTEPQALCHCRRFANGGSLTQNSQQQNGGSHSLLRTSGVPVLVCWCKVISPFRVTERHPKVNDLQKGYVSLSFSTPPLSLFYHLHHGIIIIVIRTVTWHHSVWKETTKTSPNIMPGERGYGLTFLPSFHFVTRCPPSHFLARKKAITVSTDHTHKKTTTKHIFHIVHPPGQVSNGWRRRSEHPIMFVQNLTSHGPPLPCKRLWNNPPPGVHFRC